MANGRAHNGQVLRALHVRIDRDALTARSHKECTPAHAVVWHALLAFALACTPPRRKAAVQEAAATTPPPLLACCSHCRPMPPARCAPTRAALSSSRHPQAAATAKLFSLFRSCHSKSVCQPPCAGLGKQGRSCAWRGHARKQCAGGRYSPADLKPTCQCTRHSCTSRDICSLSVCAGQPAFNDSRAEIRFARALQGQGRCWELCDGHGASVRR